MREFHLFCQFKTSGQICQSAHVSNILTQSKKKLEAIFCFWLSWCKSGIAQFNQLEFWIYNSVTPNKLMKLFQIYTGVMMRRIGYNVLTFSL